MALSTYRSLESPINRNRSSSCSSPIRNRIVYQEIYSLGANTLLRSYSCDQVFDKDASGRTFQTTQIQVSSFITPEKKITAELVNGKPKEPRRLTLQLPSDKSDIKNWKSKTEEEPNVLTAVLKRTMIFALLSVISAYALYFFVNYKDCNYIWDLKKIETDLKMNIFGQEQAMAQINGILNTCNSSKGVHVMVFTGGIGTGKTYASSIISRSIPWSSYKLITYSEYFSTDVEHLSKQKLSTCGCDLFIVDDLSVKATEEAMNLIVLLNNRKPNERLLIILIFQVHTDMERNEIINKFKSAYINIYHVPFKALTEDAVAKCFDAEIQRQGVKISNEDLRKLVEDKMKHIDIIKGPSGCKGVADEISSFASNYS